MSDITVDKLIADAEIDVKKLYNRIDEIALFNQEKVLSAFQKSRIALRHFSGTSGYGYDDTGRDTLCEIFADTFGAEAAIVSPLIASGTHAISTVLYGLLRPNDKFLSLSGTPYDTLETVISGENVGSLKDFGVTFESIELTLSGHFDTEKIEAALKKNQYKILFIQRSRGYNWRNALSIDQIENVIAFIRKFTNAPVVIDNCYGEFVETREPTQVGADIIVGSLIKNPGGGLAPTGGYIAGRKDLIEQIGYRLTAPGVGTEVGSYSFGYREFYQGFFLAPHVTAQALKGSVLFGTVFDKLGYETLPLPQENCHDIIRSIKFHTKDELIKFCQAIQACSPVDSFAVPEPWDMPGYTDQVIMAAGTFVQGASIELSADSPIREPYIAYLQGGLTYEHVKLAVKKCVEYISGK